MRIFLLLISSLISLESKALTTFMKSVTRGSSVKLVAGHAAISSATGDSLAKSLVQNSPSEQEARRLLKEVSQAYKSLRTVQVFFRYQLNNSKNRDKETNAGILWAQPSANKYMISMKDMEITSDGKQTYTYLKAQKEIQLNSIDSSATSLNPATIFSLYEKGYRCVYKKDQRLKARTLAIIDLYPTNSNAISKMQVSINKTLKQVYQVTIFDHNGDEYAYTVDRFIGNAPVDAGKFSFDKKRYPGVEIIDLR